MIEILNNQYFSRAKSFDILKKYIVLYTGKRVVILDKTLNFITEFNNLEYVYSGFPSPDETHLLLISTKNKFYIVSLVDYSINKYVIGGKEIGNLHGKGCWDVNGNAVYIPVDNKKSMISTLRKYPVDKSIGFEELLPNKYWIIFISLITSLRKYLIIGLDRNTHCWHLLWYDGNNFENYLLKNFNDAILNVEVNEQNEILIFGAEQYAKYDFWGKEKDVEYIELTEYTFNFTEIFNQKYFDDEKIETIKNIAEEIRLNKMFIKEKINTIYLSSTSEQIFIGTSLSLFIMDVGEKKIIEKRNFKYGVKKIIEISANLIIVSTFEGVKILKIHQNS